ncbi:rCG63486 [Rattus norvegicus]|uniref:RCG63486 n=1 Tax=Rattus norvegicus TaxID=10116 RepID=A6HI22_RAT|nr:rCG63486 [Rattus norvegicus]
MSTYLLLYNFRVKDSVWHLIDRVSIQNPSEAPWSGAL